MAEISGVVLFLSAGGVSPTSSFDPRVRAGNGWREGLTRNPTGEVGSVLRFTAQSINVEVPRIANTMTLWSSMGTDLMTIARVPPRQLALTCVSFSAPLGVA